MLSFLKSLMVGTVATIGSATGTTVPNLNRFYCGIPGSAKSTGVILDILPLLRRPRYWFSPIDPTAERPAILVCDLHGSTVFDLLGQITMMGITFDHGDVIYEPLHATDRVLGTDFNESCDDPDPFQREQIDNQNTRARMEYFGNRRNFATFAANPMIEEGLYGALTIMNGHPAPISEAPWLFYRGTPQYRWLLDNAQKDDSTQQAVAKLRLKEHLNEREYDFHTGAPRRFLEGTMRSPVFRNRCHGPFRFANELPNKPVILIEGNGRGVDRDDFLTYSGFAIISAVNFCREFFARTGKPFYCLIVLEEALNAGLITTYLMRVLAEGRKWGVYVWIVTQGFPPVEILPDLLTGCETHIYYKQGYEGNAKTAAMDLLGSVDLYAVHHVTERVIGDGYEEIDAQATSVGMRSDGTPDVRTTTSKRLQPKQKKVQDNHYLSVGDQLSNREQQLLSLQRGQRIVKDADGIHTEQLNKLPEPYPFKVTRPRLLELIDELRQRDIFTPPQPWTYPTPPPSAPPSVPTRTPKPPTNAAPSGIKKSARKPKNS